MAGTGGRALLATVDEVGEPVVRHQAGLDRTVVVVLREAKRVVLGNLVPGTRHMLIRGGEVQLDLWCS